MGWYFAKCFIITNLLPFIFLGISFWTFLFFLRLTFKQSFLRGMWSFLLHFGCCVVVIADMVLVFEEWLLCRFDFYAVLFCLIVSAGNFLPTFDSGGNLPHKWDNTVTRCCLGLSQYCCRQVSAANCTSGWHGCVWSWCSYLNVLHGAWCGYQNFCCYHKSPTTPSNDLDSSDDPCGWFYCPLYLSLLWSTIHCSCRLTVHLWWWLHLKHWLDIFNTTIWWRFSSFRSFLPLLGEFLYNSILWCHAAIFGSNFSLHPTLSDSGFIFAAMTLLLPLPSNTFLFALLPNPCHFFLLHFLSLARKKFGRLFANSPIPCNAEVWRLMKQTSSKPNK